MKLQLKPDQHVELLFEPERAGPALDESRIVREARVDDGLLVFVANREVLESIRDRISERTKEGRLVWVAYPKAGQLGTDLNRDSLASTLATNGIKAVRQVAIDDVWSALRFRPG